MATPASQTDLVWFRFLQHWSSHPSPTRLPFCGLGCLGLPCLPLLVLRRSEKQRSHPAVAHAVDNQTAVFLRALGQKGTTQKG